MNAHRATRAPSEAETAAFRSVLVPIDMSPLSDRVLGRVALLPLAERSELTLVHVVPRGLPAHSRRAAERNARNVLGEEARALRAKLSRRASVQCVVTVGVAAAEIARCAASRRAELIVMGRGGGRTIRDLFLGSTAERVIRRGQRPVLAVRLRPRTVYGRPALALAADQAAQEAVAMLLRLVPRPRGRLAVIHAFDIPYYGLRHTSGSDAGRHLRDHYRREASREVTAILAKALAKAAPHDAPSRTMYVQHGSPRTVIRKVVERAGADLLVLGTRGHTGATHALLGSVAGDVLRDVECDALVVPPRRRRSR